MNDRTRHRQEKQQVQLCIQCEQDETKLQRTSKANQRKTAAPSPGHRMLVWRATLTQSSRHPPESNSKRVPSPDEGANTQFVFCAHSSKHACFTYVICMRALLYRFRFRLAQYSKTRGPKSLETNEIHTSWSNGLHHADMTTTFTAWDEKSQSIHSKPS